MDFQGDGSILLENIVCRPCNSWIERIDDVIVGNRCHVWVGQESELEPLVLNVLLRLGFTIRTDADEFCSRSLNRCIVLLQINELISAEGSPDTAEETEHGVFIADIIAKRVQFAIAIG